MPFLYPSSKASLERFFAVWDAVTCFENPQLFWPIPRTLRTYILMGLELMNLRIVIELKLLLIVLVKAKSKSRASLTVPLAEIERRKVRNAYEPIKLQNLEKN